MSCRRRELSDSISASRRVWRVAARVRDTFQVFVRYTSSYGKKALAINILLSFKENRSQNPAFNNYSLLLEMHFFVLRPYAYLWSLLKASTDAHALYPMAKVQSPQHLRYKVERELTAFESWRAVIIDYLSECREDGARNLSLLSRCRHRRSFLSLRRRG